VIVNIYIYSDGDFSWDALLLGTGRRFRAKCGLEICDEQHFTPFKWVCHAAEKDKLTADNIMSTTIHVHCPY